MPSMVELSRVPSLVGWRSESRRFERWLAAAMFLHVAGASSALALLASSELLEIVHGLRRTHHDFFSASLDIGVEQAPTPEVAPPPLPPDDPLPSMAAT